MINGFADELLVEGGTTGAHSVLEIIQTHDLSHSELRDTPVDFSIYGGLLLDPGFSS